MTSMSHLTAKYWGRLTKTGIPALALVALFLLSGGAAASVGSLSLPPSPAGLGGTAGLAHSGASTVVHAVAPSPAASPASPASAAAPLAPVSSGRGTFFNNSPIPFPNGPGNQTCIYGSTYYCGNNSNDPSMNYTSNGVLAVAYTEYTNESRCTNVSAYAQTEIGFSTSTNNGGTWSTPIYLGNSNCTVASQYASAWEPSLTSLANGTLVLAFIAFNFSASYYSIPDTYFGPYTWDVSNAALMLTESYDNGVTWTSPKMLNSSSNPGLNASAYTPERPWVTATGNTVYVSWMSYSQGPTDICCYYNASGGGTSAIRLLVSTNGGSSFGSMITLSNILNPGNYSMGLNPFAMTDPSGNLYIAYSTNWTFWYQYPTGCSATCQYDVWTTEVELAKSSNNGTSFSYSTIDPNALGVPYRWSSMVDPSPQLAYSAAKGQVYATWSASMIQQICTTYGYCYSTTEPANYFANSSTGGATWTAAHLVSSALTVSAGEQEYNPGIAVTSDGTIHLEMSYIDQTPSVCPPYGYNCPQWEIYLNSTDNGTTFSSPIYMSDNVTGSPYAPDGEYVTAVAHGMKLWFAWAHEQSLAAPGVFPYWPDPLADNQIVVSQLYDGTGISLTFQEKGLKTGVDWAINILGNVRQGTAPTSLVFAGVPPSENLTWNVSSGSAGYGIRYFPTGSVNPAWTFPTSSTIYENYSEQVLVNITSNPNLPSCAVSYNQYCWNYTYQIHENYNITPGPQAYWVNNGTSFSESVTPTGFYCSYAYCYAEWLNLTFQSWTGSGAGSVNSSSANISFKALGPVNETANFRVDGSCLYYSYYSPPLQCTLLNQSLMFHQTGLPNGVNWSVTLFGALGQTVTQTSNSSWMTIQDKATLGIVNYAIWTIPIGNTGMYWIGTGNPASPVELPGDRLVNVTFSAGYPSAGSFGTTFRSAGLPNETAWTLDLGNGSYGVQNATYNTSLAGGSYTVGGDPIYLDNGSGYYLTEVSVQSLVMNTTGWTNTSSVPSSIHVDGPTVVVLSYSSQYWLTVTAGTGGTVTPSSQWVHSGAAVQLNATPDAGFSFVAWTGMGSGSISSRTINPVAHPTGPVTELATFLVIPPPLWTVNVTETGLPAGATYSVTVGSQTISGSGTLSVTGLSSGTYAVSFAYSYDNASNSTRYAPTGWTSSFSSPSSGMIAVGSDGTVQATFETQYLLTVTSTGSGAVAPAPGVGWWTAGSTVTLTATPDPHYQLAGWFGSGAGSVSAPTLQIAPVINGPVKETAQFIWKPTSPPETFNLTVAATGLPGGILWNASAGAMGVEGSTSQLMIAGLNGSYTVTIAPVQVSSGVRYVASGSGTVNVSVTGNSELNVTFTKQYLLTVSNATGGTVSPQGSQWVDAGATVTLTATVTNSTWAFVSWNTTGSSTASTNATSTTVTVTAPTTVLATFQPVYPVHTTGSTTDGQTTAIGLFVVLLVVALLVGLLLGRRRSSPPAQTEEAPSEAVPGTEGGQDDTATTPPPNAEYDEGQA